VVYAKERALTPRKKNKKKKVYLFPEVNIQNRRISGFSTNGDMLEMTSPISSMQNSFIKSHKIGRL